MAQGNPNPKPLDEESRKKGSTNGLEKARRTKKAKKEEAAKQEAIRLEDYYDRLTQNALDLAFGVKEGAVASKTTLALMDKVEKWRDLIKDGGELREKYEALKKEYIPVKIKTELVEAENAHLKSRYESPILLQLYEPPDGN